MYSTFCILCSELIQEACFIQNMSREPARKAELVNNRLHLSFWVFWFSYNLYSLTSGCFPVRWITGYLRYNHIFILCPASIFLGYVEIKMYRFIFWPHIKSCLRYLELTSYPCVRPFKNPYYPAFTFMPVFNAHKNSVIIHCTQCSPCRDEHIPFSWFFQYHKTIAILMRFEITICKIHIFSRTIEPFSCKYKVSITNHHSKDS